MPDIEARHGTSRVHGETFRQANMRIRFDMKQIKQMAFFCMVGAGGVAGGRPDSAMPLINANLRW